MNKYILDNDVILIQSLVIAILGIFEGYLALGLIVGIAGIGVVTVRSVSERRKTIGILRALGYRRKMVTASFLIEVSWVGVLGILNGVLVALGFHYSLYRAFWEDQGADFVKTSTGFSTGGATIDDIRLIRKSVGKEMGIKASGGIRTLLDIEAMVEAGANRIGTSKGAEIFS